MDGRPIWTDCDVAGDYVVPNVLSPRDLVSRPDSMDETVSHMCSGPQLKTDTAHLDVVLGRSHPKADSAHAVGLGPTMKKEEDG